MFAVNQKSERLIIFYMIFSAFCLITRGIISLLVLISYENIVSVCNYIYNPNPTDNDDNIGPAMATKFLVILVIFFISEILLSLVCLVQGSQSKEEYSSFYNL